MNPKDILKSTSFFADVLTDAEIDMLAARARFIDFPKGATPIEEDGPGHSMFVIVSGTVSITIAGEERPVATLGPGGIFGEMSLLTGARRSATVTALGPVRTVEVEQAGARPRAGAVADTGRPLRRVAPAPPARTRPARRRQRLGNAETGQGGIGRHDRRILRQTVGLRGRFKHNPSFPAKAGIQGFGAASPPKSCAGSPISRCGSAARGRGKRGNEVSLGTPLRSRERFRSGF